jgi:hypothetical protein
VGSVVPPTSIHNSDPKLTPPSPSRAEPIAAVSDDHCSGTLSRPPVITRVRGAGPLASTMAKANLPSTSGSARTKRID